MSSKIWKRFLLLLAFVGLVLGAASPLSAIAQPAEQDRSPGLEIEAELQNQLTANGSTGYLIYLREKADLTPAYSMNWEERGQFVMKALQETAERSQKNVRAYLDSQQADYQAFWIDNVIVVEQSSTNTFNALTESFPEIEALRARRQPILFTPTDSVEVPMAAQAIESNLTHINVPDVWTLGITGEDIVVANIDTGVHYTHQALVGHYRGNLGGGNFNHNYSWFEPYFHDAVPNDYDISSPTHGSHTMGTMVGDDGGANRIGVAPGAKWIACQGFNTFTSDGGLLACGQFMLAPTDTDGNNPNATLRPHVVSNSWGNCGNPTLYTDWYEGVVASWRAAGIYPVFANGNIRYDVPCPHGFGQVGNAARYAGVTGVGALGRDNATLASYSLWGPTDQVDTINPRGYPNLKPQVSAPGTNRSILGLDDTSYQDMSGTSMAAPHVAGLVALIWDAAPCLIGNYADTETILEETATATILTDYPAHALDGPGGIPNQATGWGEINALAAVQAAQAFCSNSSLKGTVTDAISSAPIHDVVIAATGITETRRALTNAQGHYTLGVWAGSYAMTASAFGYQPATVPSVEVVLGSVTTQDFILTPLPHYTVSGKVTDANTGWPLYASIAIDGYPGAPIWTDPVDGTYSISLPEGIAFTFHASAFVDGYQDANAAVGLLTGNVTQNFTLGIDSTTCRAPGYTQQNLYLENFDSATPPALPAGWSVADTNGTLGNWATSASTVHPNGQAPYSGPNLAYFNAWTTSSGNATRLYRTVGINLSGLSQASVNLWVYHDTQFKNTDSVEVQISTDGGTTWTTVETPIYRYDDSEGWKLHSVNINAYTGAGMTDVRLGLLATGRYGNDIHVDDVAIALANCNIPAGGLVVGNVYDENTSTGLVGALVSSAEGSATSVETPNDPAVEDGFYVFYASAGTKSITAAMSNQMYAPDTRNVTVFGGNTVGQDFYLNSPSITVSPGNFLITLAQGHSLTLPLKLTNSGNISTSFKILEYPANVLLSQQAIPAEPITTQREQGRVVTLSNAGASESIQSSQWVNANAVPLVFDDGSMEDSDGLSDWTYAYQFIWLNRFTPKRDAFPFDLKEVSIVWPAGETTPGDAMQLAIYSDTDGDGNISDASLLASYTVTVQIANSSTWNTYTLNPAVHFTGPGDVVIGVVDRFIESGITLDISPAAIDLNSNQGRSWAGWWLGDPPNPPVFPPDDRLVVINGNWMLRGSGVTSDVDIPWLSKDLSSGTAEANGTQSIDITFDTMTYPIGTYTAMLKIRSNDPANWNIDLPVTMAIVAPTYGVELTPATASIHGAPGETVTCTLHIRNTAVVANTFTIVDSGGTWDVTVPATPITVAGGQETDFTIAVTIPSAADIGDEDTITITVSGAGGTTASAQVTTIAGYKINLPLLKR